MTDDRPFADVVLLADSTALPDDRTGSIPELLAVVGEAVAGGVRTVIVRDKHRTVDERRALVDGVRDHLAPTRGTVLIAHDDPDADLLGADGIHLSAAVAPGHARCQTPSVASDRWRGWSAHDVCEVANAADNGADYVTVSPIYPTASKPGYGPALGPSGLAQLIAESPVLGCDAAHGCEPAQPGTNARIPVVALGGITTSTHVAECRAAGAVGVAVMGAILRSPDPASTAATLIAGTTSPEDSARCRSVSGLDPADSSRGDSS